MASVDHPALENVPASIRRKLSAKAVDTILKVHHWVETECIPAELMMDEQLQGDRWTVQPKMRELRSRARSAGLFNLFLPKTFEESPGLTNLEYACCAMIMGRCFWAAEVRKLYL